MSSQNGLIQISSVGCGGNMTEGWIIRETWQELTPQKHVRAIKHATSYFAFGRRCRSAIGFTVELSSQDQIVFHDLAAGRRTPARVLAAEFSPNEFDIDNVLVDPWTGVGLLVQRRRDLVLRLHRPGAGDRAVQVA